MHRIVQLGAVLASAAALAAPAAAAPHGLQTPCGRISGPTVRWNGQTFRHYVVGAFHGTTCVYARLWVGRIVREATPNGSISRPKGPAGWSCIANTTGHIAFNGSCRSGLRSFSWGAAV